MTALVNTRHGDPQIALRRDPDDSLDDVVVTGVEMFRAEMMSEQDLWLCCYLTNGERITWWVKVERGRMPLWFGCVEEPEHYVDFDEARKRT